MDGPDRRKMPAGAAALLGGMTRSEGAMRGKAKLPHGMQADRRDATVPLVKDSWTPGVVQRRVLSVDPNQAALRRIASPLACPDNLPGELCARLYDRHRQDR